MTHGSQTSYRCLLWLSDVKESPSIVLSMVCSWPLPSVYLADLSEQGGCLLTLVDPVSGRASIAGDRHWFPIRSASRFSCHSNALPICSLDSSFGQPGLSMTQLTPPSGSDRMFVPSRALHKASQTKKPYQQSLNMLNIFQITKLARCLNIK